MRAHDPGVPARPRRSADVPAPPPSRRHGSADGRRAVSVAAAGRDGAARAAARPTAAAAGAAPDPAARLRPCAARLTLSLACSRCCGLAYPVLARGTELAQASWQNRWLLLALAAGAVRVLARHVRRGPAHAAAAARHARAAPRSGRRGFRVWLRDVPGVLRAVALVLLIVAIARPVNTLRPQTTDEEGIDIVVVLDLSGLDAGGDGQLPGRSGAASRQRRPRGMRPTRLDAAKAVIRDFIARRKTDRIGVVVFGKEAYVAFAADARLPPARRAGVARWSST